MNRRKKYIDVFNATNAAYIKQKWKITYCLIGWYQYFEIIYKKMSMASNKIRWIGIENILLFSTVLFLTQQTFYRNFSASTFKNDIFWLLSTASIASSLKKKFGIFQTFSFEKRVSQVWWIKGMLHQIAKVIHVICDSLFFCVVYLIMLNSTFNLWFSFCWGNQWEWHHDYPKTPKQKFSSRLLRAKFLWPWRPKMLPFHKLLFYLWVIKIYSGPKSSFCFQIVHRLNAHFPHVLAFDPRSGIWETILQKIFHVHFDDAMIVFV